MRSPQQLFRVLGMVAALALIAAAFFHFNFSLHEEPPPLFRLETPQANSSPVDQSLEFTAPGLEGGQIDLSDYRGHPVILDFWATWCAPCRKQIPELISLYKKYNKSRGLVVIGIACDMIEGDGAAAVLPFVQEFRINYPIALADQRLVDSLGVEAIPTTLFLGPDGKMVSRVVGAGHPGEITANAKILLDGGKASKPAPSGHVAKISLVY